MGEVDSEENKAIFIQNLSAAHSRESQELRNSPCDSLFLYSDKVSPYIDLIVPVCLQEIAKNLLKASIPFIFLRTFILCVVFGSFVHFLFNTHIIWFHWNFTLTELHPQGGIFFLAPTGY